MGDEPSAKTAKGTRTRQRILDAALELFREHGYEQTTMRQVAEKAGVAVGNAYYYFASKEHLVQGFYGRSHQEHLAVCLPLLRQATELEDRLRIVLETKIATSAPYQRMSTQLFKTAADPSSPLDPFSAASAEVRDQAVALMGDVVEGSTTKIHADLRPELPELLWLYEMSSILFWIHDTSEGNRRTHRMIDHTCRLVVRLLKLSGLPLMGGVRKQTLELLADLRDESPPAGA